jgi:hypothetical protein
MSIRFRYDPELKILFTTAEGLVTFEEIQSHLDEESHAGALAYRELFDAMKARTNLTASEVRLVVGLLKSMMHAYRMGPTAVVTVNDVFYGMASMMAIVSEIEAGPRIAVFRSFDKGLEWLVRI